ncbi:TadA family conjugal transfer-associated ATPase [Cellulomonas alba]|uniref:TadA family conjugal transfer-associated ATPase n=1 Tax=Cellulomonas alba TaxID=3053467 RepID=A0ABT7SE63_9CELL|nr:TadA family conjugal transfer-associated ATPase [Cellulomonas alba]MDM7854469.1 TadA family conjugal transfer-associated ATPase [Cellulomonas alba]
MTGEEAAAAVVELVRHRVAGRPAPPDEALAVTVAETAREAGLVLGAQGLALLVGRVRDDVWGAGPLQPFLDDPDVTDVLVNGPDDVWVDRAGRLTHAPVRLGTGADVRALAVRLAASAGQRLDDAAPVVDARLADGTRLHAVLPPLAGVCTLLSLRTVRRRAFALAALTASGTLAPGLEVLLTALVRARATILVSGSTGAGKTTLLAALVGVVPRDERVVVIEESEELRPEHPHVVRLLARSANVEGAGRVDLTDLVRQALRMRPDRIVLGECRGPEVRDVLGALNTGHDGGFATLHANTAADVPARLEALGALAGLTQDALAAQAASALDVVLHVRREGGRRYVAEAGVVRRAAGGRLEVATALVCDARGTTVRHDAYDALVRLAERPAGS